jgi:hypothetical protein
MKIRVSGQERISAKARRMLWTRLKRLGRACHLERDLWVQIKPDKKYHGQAWKSRRLARITLTPVECEECVQDTLTHEWAHLMQEGSEEPHGPGWGVAYAKCYRAAEKVR